MGHSGLNKIILIWSALLSTSPLSYYHHYSHFHYCHYHYHHMEIIWNISFTKLIAGYLPIRYLEIYENIKNYGTK